MTVDSVSLANGILIPKIGMGTFPLKGKALRDTFRLAYSLGYRLFDSAWLYHNESDIRKTIEECDIPRETLFLTSKLHQDNLFYINKPNYHLVLRRKTIRKAFSDTLRRLGCSYLDLYLIHAPFENFTEMWDAISELYEIGEIRAIGVSNFEIRHLEKLIGRGSNFPLVNQIEINPYNYNKDLILFCKQHSIAIEAFSPFGRGMITRELLNDPILVEISKDKKKSVAQIILKWLVQQDIIAIPRSTNENRLRDNINVFDFVLSEDELSMISDLDKGICTVGGTIHKRK